VNARQNPLTALAKFEDLLEWLLELPFEFFPTPIEPIELGKKLCKFMGRNSQLLGDGRQSVPHVYDIFVSPKDLKNFKSISTEKELIEGWRKQLNAYARQRNYVVRDTFVLRLHEKLDLRVGKVEFEVGQVTNQAETGTQRIDKLLNWASPAGPSPIASPSPFNAPVPIPVPPARLVRRPVQGSLQTYIIDKPIVRIGRQLDNDVIVPDKNVGRYHAVIEYQNGKFILNDLKSANGTVVNKVPVMGPRVLHNNDVIIIGSYELVFERK
jgi:hypothetical protein